MVQDKARGPQSALRAAHTAPQCGSGNVYAGVRFWTLGSNRGSNSAEMPMNQGFERSQKCCHAICGRFFRELFSSNMIISSSRHRRDKKKKIPHIPCVKFAPQKTKKSHFEL